MQRGANVVSVTPQVFDLLDYLIRNRERVVSKGDLVYAIWHGRVVSDAALTTRLDAARTRSAIAARNGASSRRCRAKASVSSGQCGKRRGPQARKSPNTQKNRRNPLFIPDKPSIAVLPFENMSGDVEQEYFADGVVDERHCTLAIQDAVRHRAQFEL